jgi:hypothetical protein
MNLFYYPNRPMLVPPDPQNPLCPQPTYINGLEAQGLYDGAEFKWNGDNTTVYTDDLSFWNRQGKRLSYTPHPGMIKELKRFPKRSILNGELMHRHTKQVKDLLILHCVMGWDGKLLLGKTWGYSRQILEHLAWLPRTVGTQLSYGCHVVLAQVHPAGKVSGKWWDLFNQARACDDSIEGIVLKNSKGKLIFSVNPIADVNFMLKIRKPSKKYSF